jgi:Cu/Ag efflux protein CusF
MSLPRVLSHAALVLVFVFLAAQVADATEATGRVVGVAPDKNQLVLSQSLKDLTFTLAKNAKVYLNDVETTLASLKAGDQASVTYERQGQQLTATVVRCTRK